MSETTARFGLPLIQPGQAQKELSHNEALAALDLLVQPAVVALGIDVPPTDPVPGQCWIVGRDPSGVWRGQAHALAGWTDGGWRFVAPLPGMAVWVGGDEGFAHWSGSDWRVGDVVGAALRIGGQRVVGARRPAISDPADGGTMDPGARAAIAGILAALRGHGLIDP